MHITTIDAIEKLKNDGGLFTTLFEHGSLQVEIYKPCQKDLQEPHTRDEVYIIICGNGKFLNGTKVVTFVKGDFLFVAAGTIHRFIEFSEDFITWVIFYGPEGGEKKN